MEQLVIIAPRQFGYHTDAYQVSLKLCDKFQVSMVCFDSGESKYASDRVNVIYVPRKGGKLRNGINFLRTARNVLKGSAGIGYIYYFPLCAFLTLCSRRTFLDIRTGGVHVKRLYRFRYNALLRFESLFFQRIIVISEGLRRKLRLSRRNTSIVPLGAESISSTNKIFDNPRLLYVGTFNNRRLLDTLLGLKDFLEKHSAYRPRISYDIVGDGYLGEMERMQKFIELEQLSDVVVLHGRKRHQDIVHLFDTCNIGVSYIPMTDFFDHQPPTKTLEYIFSGMSCLATKTRANAEFVSRENGILHDDHPRAFCQALERWVEIKSNYDSPTIRNTQLALSWENVVDRVYKVLTVE